MKLKKEYILIILLIVVFSSVIIGERVISKKFGSGGEVIDPTTVTTGATTADPNITYVTDTTDDFAVGGTNSSAALWFDVSKGELTVTGNATSSKAMHGLEICIGNDCKSSWPSSTRTATKIVCASDAIDTTNCDYLCDGTADESEIDSALVAINAVGGGKVILSDGTFTVSGHISMDYDKTILEGQGRGTLIQTAANDYIIYAAGSTPIQDDIVIRDISFDGDRSASGNQTAIYFYGVKDAIIENVWIEQMGDTAIWLRNTERVKVLNSYIEDSNDMGIFINDTNVYTSIQGNHFRLVDNGAIMVSGSNDYINIVNNVFDSSDADDILVSINADYVNIVGNWSFSPNGDGIEIFGSKRPNIVGNYIYGATGSGIKLTGNGTYSTDYAHINGNYITESGTGISMDQYVNNPIITENYVYNNTIQYSDSGATTPSYFNTTYDGFAGLGTTTPKNLLTVGDGDDNIYLDGYTTSTQALVVGTEFVAATSTLQIKADAVDGNGTSCLEMVDVNGAVHSIYLNGTTVVATAGTCK